MTILPAVPADALPGYVCRVDGEIVGYCFAYRQTGEIAVLVTLPEFECMGIGRQLLEKTVRHMQALGFTRLFLGSSPDPTARSHGFYRHLGWKPTGSYDAHGDEVLELLLTT